MNTSPDCDLDKILDNIDYNMIQRYKTRKLILKDKMDKIDKE